MSHLESYHTSSDWEGLCHPEAFCPPIQNPSCCRTVPPPTLPYPHPHPILSRRKSECRARHPHPKRNMSRLGHCHLETTEPSGQSDTPVSHSLQSGSGKPRCDHGLCGIPEPAPHPGRADTGGSAAVYHGEPGVLLSYSGHPQDPGPQEWPFGRPLRDPEACLGKIHKWILRILQTKLLTSVFLYKRPPVVLSDSHSLLSPGDFRVCPSG